MPMPALSPDLVDWLRPGAVGAGLAVVWTEIRGLHRRVDGLEASTNRRFEELRADMKEGFSQSRADMKEGFAQSRADNRALNEKLDRLLEASLTARQT